MSSIWPYHSLHGELVPGSSHRCQNPGRLKSWDYQTISFAFYLQIDLFNSHGRFEAEVDLQDKYTKWLGRWFSQWVMWWLSQWVMWWLSQWERCPGINTWVQISSSHIKTSRVLVHVPVTPRLWKLEGSWGLLVTTLAPGSVRDPQCSPLSSILIENTHLHMHVQTYHTYLHKYKLICIQFTKEERAVICTWVWSHPLEHGQPVRVHTLNENWLSFP